MQDKEGYVWNPDFGWQIVRRSDAYKNAVEEFKKMQELEGDPGNEQIFYDFLSKEYPKELNRANSLQPPLSPISDINFDSVAVHTFLEKFGDILLFPIPYDVEFPNAYYLKSLWRFRPAFLTDLKTIKNKVKVANKYGIENYDEKIFVGPDDVLNNNPIEQFHKGAGRRIVPILLELNTLFDAESIGEYVKEIVRDHILPKLHAKDEPKNLTNKSKTKIRWSEFQEMLECLKVQQQNPEWKEQRIGNVVFKDKCTTVSSRKEAARSRLKRFRELQELFEKTRPIS